MVQYWFAASVRIAGISHIECKAPLRQAELRVRRCGGRPPPFVPCLPQPFFIGRGAPRARSLLGAAHVRDLPATTWRTVTGSPYKRGPSLAAPLRSLNVEPCARTLFAAPAHTKVQLCRAMSSSVSRLAV